MDQDVLDALFDKIITCEMAPTHKALVEELKKSSPESLFDIENGFLTGLRRAVEFIYLSADSQCVKHV